MNITPHLTWTATLAGLLTTFSLLTSGCSGDSGGDGDGDTATTASGSGGAGDDLPYTFCGPISTCPPDVTGVDLTTPVSFKTDINPILFEACSGGSGCHQSSQSNGLAFSMGQPKMALDEASQQALVTYLTTNMSQIATSTPLVAPNNWQGSFLMMKIDGCQNQMGLTCSSASQASNIVCDDTAVNPSFCGDGMPQSEGTATSPVPYPLAADKLHKIRAWIAQGAQFN